MGVRKRITPLIGLVNSIDKVYHYILQLLLQERPTCDLRWQLTGGLRPVAVKRWPVGQSNPLDVTLNIYSVG